MVVGVAGLGLIGGSMAKAVKYNTDAKVYGYDICEKTMKLALLVGAVDDRLGDDNIGECDFLIVALYPGAEVEYVTRMADRIKKDSIVIDCAGTKRKVCGSLFKVADEHGFHFIGGHPMAGTQFSGFRYAKENMFRDAYMITVPKPDEDIRLLERVKKFLLYLGFGGVTVTGAERHDKVIAFTSQLAHVVSNAYVKSPNAQIHKGFSAGSYKDLTRVARLNEKMWTELFMDNKDNLVEEIECIINALSEYKDALQTGDEDRLQLLLREGREAKERIDYPANEDVRKI